MPWKSNSGNIESPYDNLSGIETFEDGDDVSHIKIKLPQQPREASEEQFAITLSPPKSTEAVLGDIDVCQVNVKNDIGKDYLQKRYQKSILFVTENNTLL